MLLEEYFFAQVWKSHFAEAQKFALDMVAEFEKLKLPTYIWLSRAGDAAFFTADYERAKDLYFQASRVDRDRAWLETNSLKLADVAYKLGDLATERAYRERFYGRLE